MEQNKSNKYFIILISFFVLSSCQFDWVEERRIYLNKIEFGLSVKDAFKQKSIKYFAQDSSNNNYSLKISNLQFKKKNFYGGEAYFQDGYCGDLASPAKMNPITQKSKSSPFKINEALVSGAALTGKKFVDVGAEVGKAFKEQEEPKAADLTK